MCVCVGNVLLKSTYQQCGADNLKLVNTSKTRRSSISRQTACHHTEAVVYIIQNKVYILIVYNAWRIYVYLHIWRIGVVINKVPTGKIRFPTKYKYTTFMGANTYIINFQVRIIFNSRFPFQWEIKLDEIWQQISIIMKSNNVKNNFRLCRLCLLSCRSFSSKSWLKKLN